MDMAYGSGAITVTVLIAVIVDATFESHNLLKAVGSSIIRAKI